VGTKIMALPNPYEEDWLFSDDEDEPDKLPQPGIRWTLILFLIECYVLYDFVTSLEVNRV